MNTQYLVERTFIIKDSTILVLDKKMSSDDFDKKFIKDGGNKISYSNTHNEYLIAIKGDHDLTGHTIEFSK